MMMPANQMQFQSSGMADQKRSGLGWQVFLQGSCLSLWPIVMYHLEAIRTMLCLHRWPVQWWWLE